MPGTIDAAIPDWIELAAVLVSALSGALLAAKGREFDVGGVAALALVAGLGGGIIRDVLLGQGAPAALRDERYLIAVLAATGLGFFFAGTLNQFQGLLIVLDAAALGLYSVVGADKADQAGLPAISAVLLGAITGVGGGIMRDLLSGTTPVIFKRDIYALLATFGSALYLALRQTDVACHRCRPGRDRSHLPVAVGGRPLSSRWAASPGPAGRPARAVATRGPIAPSAPAPSVANLTGRSPDMGSMERKIYPFVSATHRVHGLRCRLGRRRHPPFPSAVRLTRPP